MLYAYHGLRFYVFIELLILSCNLYGQNILLVDSDFTPVRNATFVYDVLDSLDNNKSSGYDISNHSGLITIQAPENGVKIRYEIRHLSYKTIKGTYRLDLLPDTIEMVPSEVELKEIVITHKQKINEAEIITYQIDSVRNLRTRTIKGVLRETDGFEVDDYQITYKNERVEHVLIDSMDISGPQYMDVVDNLKTGFFKEFQLIKNYYKDPTEKIFKEGDLAININSKDLNRWNVGFDVEAGYDTRNRTDLGADVFANSARLKLLGLSRMREIEHEYLSLSTLSEGPEYYSSDFGISDWSSELVHIRPRLPFDRFDSWFYDETYYGAKLISGIGTANGGTHRIALNYGDNTFNQSEQNSLEQNYIEGVWKYTRRSDMLYESNLLGLEHQFEKPGDHSYLKYGGHLIIPSFQSDYHSVQSGDLNEDLSHTLEEHPQYRTGLFFDYSRLSDTRARHNIRFEWISNRQELSFLPDVHRMQNFFSGQTVTRESSLKRERNGKLEYKYLKILGSYTGQIGGIFRGDHLSFDHSWYSRAEKDTMQNESTTGAGYALIKLSLFPRQTMNMQLWTTIQLKTGYSFLNTEHTIYSDKNRYVPIELDWNLSKRIREWNVLSLSYHFKHQYPELQYNHPEYFITDSYSYVHPLTEWQALNTHRFKISYQSKPIGKLRDYRLSMEYSYRPDAIGQNTTFFIDYSEETYYYRNEDRITMDGNFSSMFLHLPISFEFDLHSQYGHYSNIINGNDVDLVLFSYNPDLTVSVKTKWIQFHFGGAIEQWISEIKGNRSFSNLTTQYQCNIEFNSGKKQWQLAWDNEFRFRDGHELQFPGGRFTVRRYFKTFDISCWIHNLYNADYEQIDIDPLNKYTYRIPLNPRSAGLRLKWDL